LVQAAAPLGPGKRQRGSLQVTPFANEDFVFGRMMRMDADHVPHIPLEVTVDHKRAPQASVSAQRVGGNVLLQALHTVFENERVRTIGVDCNAWFVAGDLARVLGYGRQQHALKLLDADEKGTARIETNGGDQILAVVSESGLYHLIDSSTKPNAKAFRRIVTGEILPQIRRTGRYEATSADISGDKQGETLIERVADAAQVRHPGEPEVTTSELALINRVRRVGRYLVVSLPDHPPHVEELDLHGVFRDFDDADMDGLVHAVQLIGSLWTNYCRYDTLTGQDATATTSGIGTQLDHAIRLGRSLAHTLSQRRKD